MTPEGPDMDMVEKLVRRGRRGKGYLVRAEIFQSAGLYLFRGDGEAFRAPEAGGSGFPYLLG